MTKEEIRKQIVHTVETIRRTNPMAPSLTNTVTVNFVANAQIAVGGSAAMFYLPDEGETLGTLGGATYINMGTLLPVYGETVPRTLDTLRGAGRPWVLDPVAVGVGALRTKLLLQMKEYRPDIIRGNASEIIALAGLWQLEGGSETTTARGVDSTDSVSTAKRAAAALARWTGGAVSVSGSDDYVTNGTIGAVSHGGSHFMEEITGSGCSLGGVSAVYLCAASPFTAALTAVSAYNLAGFRAGRRTTGPASFQSAFLDELYLASPEEIAENPFELEEVSE